MKRILITTIAILLTAAMLAGCGSTPTISVTTLPMTTAPASATQSVIPSVLPSPTIEPSPTVIPTPTVKPPPTIKPTPTDTPSPTEQIVIHNTNIPDIIEGDGRNLWNNFYEDDENLYYLDTDYSSLYSINKITGNYVTLLKYCGAFCVEGDYIYWTENKNSGSSIKKYDIKAKVNTTICSTEKFTNNLQADNGRLYYIMYGSGNPPVSDLYSIDINGGNSEKLLDGVQRYIIYNNNIFYTPRGNYDKTSIYMYNIDSKNPTELDGKIDKNPTFCTAYGKIYFYDVDEGCVISIDIASGEKKIFRDANSFYEIKVIGQHFFYFNEHGDNKVLRAYDMINGEYYYITSKYIDSLEASNKNLYFINLGEGESYTIYQIIISGGKASIKKVKGLD